MEILLILYIVGAIVALYLSILFSPSVEEILFATFLWPIAFLMLLFTGYSKFCDTHKSAFRD